MSSDPATQVIIRLPSEIAARLEAVASKYLASSSIGLRVGKATVAREAILRGLPILEKEMEEKHGTDSKSD